MESKALKSGESWNKCCCIMKNGSGGGGGVHFRLIHGEKEVAY